MRPFSNPVISLKSSSKIQLHMKKAFFCGLLMSAITLFPAFNVFAWDDVGHKLTAYIAWQQMTPEVRERVIKILLAAPEDAQLSTFYLPYASRTAEANKREFFMIAAS